MKTKTILVALCVIAGIGATSQTAEAAGYMIDDTTAVFFQAFSLNASYGNFAVPLAADHTARYSDRVNVLGYQITTTSQDTPEILSVSDVVLSTSPIVDGKYRLDQDTIGTFSLISIVKFAQPVTSELTSTITKLPYWVDGRRTSVHENQLADIAPVTILQ